MSLAADAAARAATAWLHRTYRGQVEIAGPQPTAESERAWVYACRALPQPGYPRTPMLAASVAVPKHAGTPFHLGNADPWGDLASFDRGAMDPDARSGAHRLNARGCVISADAMVSGGRSVALPWKPADEAPGWWQRLIRRYFLGAQVGECGTWDDAITAVRDGGPGSRGVVWIRREYRGAEVTGHLVYAVNNDGQVALLDAQSGGLARLETDGVRKLTLARFHRPTAEPGSVRAPWDCAAPDLPAAVRKAEAWLRETYGDGVALVRPSPADELARGWLFACNTRRFLASGDWRSAMVDAALIVPKDNGAPFGLPNSEPWSWLQRWDAGAEPGDPGMDLVPSPGTGEWLPAALTQLGSSLAAAPTAEHADWSTAIPAVVSMPVGGRALVWVRRQDRAGRETVGRLLTAAMADHGLILIDPMREGPAELEPSEHILRIHVIRYR